MHRRDERRNARPPSERKAHRSCWGCLCLVPWVPLASCAVLAVGIPLWWVYYGKLRDGTMAALANTHVGQSFMDTVDLWTWRAHLAAVVLIVFAVAMVIVTALSNLWTHRGINEGRASPGPRTLQYCMVLDGLLVFLLWLLALCFVVLVAVYLVWVALIYVAEGGINLATGYTTVLEATLRNALAAGSNVLTTIQGDITTAVDKVPAPILADLTGIVGKMQQAFDKQRELLSQAAPNNPCNASCVDVGFFVQVGVLQDPCVCITDRLLQIQAPLMQLTDSGDGIPVVLGQALLYIASSWLVMTAVASFVKASRDLLHQRHARALEHDNLALASAVPIMGPPAANMAMMRDQHPNEGTYKDVEGAHAVASDTAATNDRAPLHDGPSSNCAAYPANGGVNGQFDSGWNSMTNPIGAFNL